MTDQDDRTPLKIRIAQRGMAFGAAAETLEEVICGMGAEWVEINGMRTSEVQSIKLEMGGDAMVTKPTISFFAQVEIVYLDKDGEILGARGGSPKGTIDALHTLPRRD